MIINGKLLLYLLLKCTRLITADQQIGNQPSFNIFVVKKYFAKRLGHQKTTKS